MKKILLFILCLFIYFPINAFAVIDNDAEVVTLRKDCGTMNNCFTTMDSLLTWTWGTRLPAAATPLLVDIGPGDYLDFSCDNAGYVTLRGSGRDNTRITTNRTGVAGAVEVTGCEDLAFQDLTIQGAQGGSNYSAGVIWNEGGSSTYSNVELIVKGNEVYGWYDDCPATGDRSVHYWFGSTVTGINTGYYNNTYSTFCAENWFYGGEITATSVAGSGPVIANTAIRVGDTGDIRLFGSVVRSFDDGGGRTYGNIGFGGLKAVVVDGNAPASAKFHMHGGIINVNGDQAAANTNVVALYTTANAFAHVMDTAYNVSTNLGTTGYAQRIQGPGANSHYQWPASGTPPQIFSKNGSDTFIEKDCGSDGNCDGGGNEVHLMIYTHAECGLTDPWFDTRMNACRAVNTP